MKPTEEELKKIQEFLAVNPTITEGEEKQQAPLLSLLTDSPQSEKKSAEEEETLSSSSSESSSSESSDSEESEELENSKEVRRPEEIVAALEAAYPGIKPSQKKAMRLALEKYAALSEKTTDIELEKMQGILQANPTIIKGEKKQQVAHLSLFINSPQSEKKFAEEEETLSSSSSGSSSSSESSDDESTTTSYLLPQQPPRFGRK